MARLTNEQLSEHLSLAKDQRLHARHCDDLARADKERGDWVSERMWRLEAKALRRLAREHDEAVKDERFWRRWDKRVAKRAAQQKAGVA